MPIQAPSTRTGQRTSANGTKELTKVITDRLALFAAMSKRLGDKAKADLYRELHLLISSGVDPGTVFTVLAGARKDDQRKELYLSIRRSLAQGRSLSAALAAEGVFSKYEEQSVQVGEETGRLSEVFEELAENFDAKVELRRTLLSAFAYPLFVLCVTGAVVAFMLRVVVPMFSDVFHRSGAELPAITQLVVRMSAASGPALIMLGLLTVTAFIFYALVKDRPAVKHGVAWLMVRLPLVGTVYSRSQFARFYRAMASMLAAQLPLDRALALAADLVELYTLRLAVLDIRERVLRGGHLHEACSVHGLFDAKDVAMIAVAEEVRQLDRMFLRLSEERAAEVKHRTAMMGSVLEPAMIVVIAVFVGTILVAMYLPMFKLSTAF